MHDDILWLMAAIESDDGDAPHKRPWLALYSIIMKINVISIVLIAMWCYIYIMEYQIFKHKTSDFDYNVVL